MGSLSWCRQQSPLNASRSHNKFNSTDIGQQDDAISPTASSSSLEHSLTSSLKGF